MMNKTLFALAGALAALSPTAGAWATPTDNLVFVGGTVIMRVRVPAGGYSAAERAGQIQERVNRLLGQGPIDPSEITVHGRQGEAVVAVKGQVLFTADEATARFNHTTPYHLASLWAERMRKVLPALTEPK